MSAPDFDDAALDAQAIGSLSTLLLLAVFCAGVAFGWAVA